MTTIYHNPRCRKSRETLALLEERKESLDIILYLDKPPSEAELGKILKQLDMSPIELVRRNEQVWKDNYKGKKMSDAEIITAMVENPKLIERPIVVKNNKAALGRPPENVIEIL